MISKDIIIMAVLVIFVVVILNLNIVNAKKIRKSQAEAKLKEEQSAEKEKAKEKVNEKAKVVNASENYLHDIANLKPFTVNDIKLEIQEVDSSEIEKPTLAVGQTKKFTDNFVPDEQFNHSSYIINELDQNMQDDEEFEEDFDIGLEDEKDVQFKNALAEEFKNLSPAMKAFIMSNILKGNHNNDDKDI